MSTLKQPIRSERGIALITVLMIAMVVAVISVSAALVSSNAKLINAYGDRQSKLEAAADAGIDLVRSQINGNKALYPDTGGYRVFENGVAVYDASGAVIPGLSRWLYAGPTGNHTGQYGVFGSVVSIVQDNTGNKVVRRGEIVQESFAKYAYFTNLEGSIVFGGGDQIWGPVHSNDQIKINNSTPVPQVIFHGTVETASTITNKTKGQFDQGYTENAPTIPMPGTADLSKLRTQAQIGGTAFVGNSNGAAGQATTRIEFIAIDIDGVKEGFIRVYQSTDYAYVVASRPGSSLQTSKNCGHWGGANSKHNNTFALASAHTGGSGSETASQWGTWQNSLTTANYKRCYLGGSDSLLNKSVTTPIPLNWTAWTPTDAYGGYVARPGAAYTNAVLAARADQQYLFALTRTLNPNFKGVIFVDGKVAVSGQVRGKLTMAATDNIIIADDIKYVNDPGAGTCLDILGLFSGTDVVVADNSINAPVQPTGSGSYYTYDETRDEYIHGVVLALDNFTVENYNSGSSSDEPCGTTAWGRGCLYLSGGIIQVSRGAVGTTGGTGYLKRYSYDQCAAGNPPPYFPTTGHFNRGRYYEVDPTNFSVSKYYDLLTPN
jgi:hypothetical protein